MAESRIAAPEKTPRAPTETATARALEASTPEATRAAPPTPTCVAAPPQRKSSASGNILREVFRFHPLAVEDSEHFDQRAKIEDYDDFVFLVFYGASPDEDRLVEVHCFYSDRFVVTVHRDDCPAFAQIRRRYQKRDEAIDRPSLLLYRIIDGLVDSFFPILADFDDRIDELEDQIFREASDKQLQEMFAMKRPLVGMRKAVSPHSSASASGSSSWRSRSCSPSSGGAGGSENL
jgi:Mg2+ and Co2+ transporter CorA